MFGYQKYKKKKKIWLYHIFGFKMKDIKKKKSKIVIQTYKIIKNKILDIKIIIKIYFKI